MHSCDDCLYRESVYCEPDNRQRYGFCGNWYPVHDLEMEDDHEDST